MVLVDRHPRFLQLATLLLTHDAAITILGTAQTASAALAQVAQRQPTIVLLGWYLPDSTGVHVTAHLKQRPHVPTILICSSLDEPAYQHAARRAGADAFLGKRDLVEELAPLVHT